MTQKGVSKAAARRLLEEAGFFTGVSYAKRAAPDNIPRATQPGEHQHQPQQEERAQPQKAGEQLQERKKKNYHLEEKSSQRQTEAQSPEQQAETEAQQEPPEDLLQAIFGDHVDPILVCGGRDNGVPVSRGTIIASVP